MRTTSLLALVVCLQCHIAGIVAVPAKTTGEVLLGEVDIAVQEDGRNEITTEESYPKKCIVDENTYSHGQTIPSYDPNSHCMCVAGEVYCWWQNYNPSTDPSAGPSFLPSTTIESNYTPSLEGSTDAVDSFEASGDPAQEASLEQQQGYGEINATYSSTTSQPAPTTCLVMGREYREGELLPHSTGNCIECSCGSEGRVECSPRDCVALRPEIPVAPDIPDAPDGDFEVFNLARDRGIDESF
ncbi:kielin/chordin-like protein isoform X1 [Apis cerana]|uniref:kielin/chordin-like protein isoform X1 n=1 Tax=Apis cerana TaxID=7461 RepID=UPI002B22A3B1|nr:kielin/chordin-like protein isoform X1 [Apis cerana]